MKLFCLADLHWDMNMYSMEKELASQIRNKIYEEFPDVIVIAGDVFASERPWKMPHPHKVLEKYISDTIPIICVLGNHEFFNNYRDYVINSYREFQDSIYSNVAYLDVVGAVEFPQKNVKFFGNTLWYDGSTATIPNQNIYDFAEGKWNDKTIMDFDPIVWNSWDINMLQDYEPESYWTSILVTHHIPHKDLNGHINYVGSQFDAFSGVANLFDIIKPDYAICGHTHTRVVKEINKVYCINVGNDYMETNYVILEV